MCYVYILKCFDKTLYTGWTNNLDRRMDAHARGKASKYTRSRLPVKIVYIEKHSNRADAQKREYEIKQMTRKEKIKLID